MAIGLGRSRPVQSLWDEMKSGAHAAGALGIAALRAALPLGRWLASRAPSKFISRSLLRRIIVSNLLGLVILLVGMLYVSQDNVWLIEAKRESLKAQGEIIAAAIAANASVENDNWIAIEPDKLPDEIGGSKSRYDDGLSTLELSIRPERVTPILRRLVQPTTNRARIYDKDGTLIVNSAELLTKRRTAQPASEGADEARRPKTKNLWTRLTERFDRANLPVYKEIGSANGTLYPEVRMAMTGTTTPMLLLNAEGEQIVSVAVPIERPRRTVRGVLLLSTRPGEIDGIVQGERNAILWLAAIAMLATIAASIVLARTVADPVRRLSAAANHVSRNIGARHDLPDLSHRSDEVGQMASAFRSMVAALYRRAEASEKFAADVAHELKNPLTAARSTAEALSYAKSDEQRRQLVKQIQDELKRLNRLITDVSNASRLDAELAIQHMEPIELTKVLEGVVASFSDLLHEDDRTVALEIAPAITPHSYIVNGHDGRLSQVLTNLIDNAVSFSPPGGTVTVTAINGGAAVEVAVEDEGPGIPENKLEAIFERFYTDRPSYDANGLKNSGLGLSISHEIVKAHRGEIWAENRYAAAANANSKPIGARFVVRLQACKRPPSRAMSLMGRRSGEAALR